VSSHGRNDGDDANIMDTAAVKDTVDALMPHVPAKSPLETRLAGRVCRRSARTSPQVK
jgi:hypothetical protein